MLVFENAVATTAEGVSVYVTKKLPFQTGAGPRPLPVASDLTETGVAQKSVRSSQPASCYGTDTGFGSCSKPGKSTALKLLPREVHTLTWTLPASSDWQASIAVESVRAADEEGWGFLSEGARRPYALTTPASIDVPLAAAEHACVRLRPRAHG